MASIGATDLSHGGDENSFVPWEYNEPKQEERLAPPENSNTSLLARASLKGISFFQNYISRVDGDRCPMVPTCSAYAAQAIKKHGFWLGFVMTADRLIHEGSEIQRAPVIRRGDRVGFYDPVENNDFWLKHD